MRSCSCNTNTQSTCLQDCAKEVISRLAQFTIILSFAFVCSHNQASRRATDTFSYYQGKNRNSYLGHFCRVSHITWLSYCKAFIYTIGSWALAYALQPAYASAAWLTPVLLLVRLTFMLLYLQIFGPMRWMRWSCYSGITIMTLFYTSYWIAQVYISTPEHGQSWLEDFKTSRYSEFSKMAVPLGSVNLVFDVYIFVLPIAAVNRLQMSLRPKLAVSAMFLSGLA